MAEQPQQRLLNVVVNNFAAFSAVSSAVAASLSIVFIFGYLAAFNTALIMILEYSDILKFILIGICIGFGLLAVFAGTINISISIIKNQHSVPQTISHKSAMLVGFVIVILFPILLNWNNEPELHYYIFQGLAIWSGLALLLFVFRPPEFL